MVVVMAVLVQAGAGAVVLEVILVMAALAVETMEPEVVALLDGVIVLHTVDPQVAVLVLGDKVLQE